MESIDTETPYSGLIRRIKNGCLLLNPFIVFLALGHHPLMNSIMVYRKIDSNHIY
jgi:hypothetical protein